VPSYCKGFLLIRLLCRYRHSEFRASVLVLLFSAATIVGARYAIELEIDGSMVQATVPDSKEAADAVIVAERFPEESLIVVALPSDYIRSSETLSRLQSLAAALGEAGIVRSPFSVEVPVSGGGVTASRPLLVSGPDENASTDFSLIDDSTLYRRLFLGTDASAWYLYLDVQPGLEGEGLLDILDRVRGDFPEIKVAGKHYYLALNQKMMDEQFRFLLGAAAGMLLVVVLAMLRSPAYSLLLWLHTVAPTVLLLGVMSALGSRLRFHLILAPIVTLALSTSYVIHIFRGWEVLGHDAFAAVRLRGGIIVLDACTTLLGYATLVVSPIRELREIGLYSIAGSVFSLLYAMLCLPAILSLARRYPPRSKRYANDSQTPRRVYSSPPGNGRIGPRYAILVPWACVMLVFLGSSTKLELGRSMYDQFLPGSKEQKEADFFIGKGAGIEHALWVVETGKEYGLVDVGLFRDLGKFQEDLAAVGGTGPAYGYTDIVNEILASIRGGSDGGQKSDERMPVSENEIGEALELAFSAGDDGFMHRYVDGDWSSARFFLPVAADFRPSRAMPRARQMAEEWISAHGSKVSVLWGGSVVLNERAEIAFSKGQLRGAFLFYAVLFIVLLVILRSPVKSLAVVGTSAAGMIASLGFMALAGWRLSDINALALATVAGTGVDSAILLVLHGWSGEVRHASVDTTVLIVASLSVLFACGYYVVVQTAAVCIVGLVVSSVTAQYVLPASGLVDSRGIRGHG
jgi:predicted RND superfamily exporter protein